MNEDNFYTYKNGEKTEWCKKCLTMHIDNFDETTYLWLLEKMDVPYLPGEWKALLDKACAKNPDKLNGMSVFGKYLSKMKLKQWKDCGWADTERLQQEQQTKEALRIAEQAKAKEVFIQQQYEVGEISDAQYKTLMSTETLYGGDGAIAPPPGASNTPVPSSFNETQFSPIVNNMPNPAENLTKEDHLYLALKWGTLYTPNQWIELEKKYNEMIESFDIQDADTTSTLMLICKTNLKMNEAIDCGDLDGFQKLSRVYDSLRKSAKFTAAQNKDAKGEAFSSIGELVVMCEREGFIPRFATDIPQDKVDLTLKDMNKYIYNLVTQELGFGQQIEDALKKIQLQKEAEEHSLEMEEEEELKDGDYETFYDDIEKQKQKDDEIAEEDELWL